MKTKVLINSHNIVFTDMEHKFCMDLLSFTKDYMQFETVKIGGRVVRQLKAAYAAMKVDRSEVRIHRNMEISVFDYLSAKGHPKEDMDIIQCDDVSGITVDFEVVDKREPRDYQVGIIEYLVKEGRTKVITLGTGGGKTFVTLKAMAEIGQRAAIVIPGKYVEKWIGDVEEAYNISKDDLIVVRGRKDLLKVINMGLDGTLKAKVIIFTVTTLYTYIKDYESNKLDGILPPYKLFETVGVGIKLVDECHQFLHTNFRLDLYTNVDKCIFLSATLLSNDEFIEKILGIIYPHDYRMQGRPHVKYIDVMALSYYIENGRRIKVKRRGAYSHVAFEQSIMRNTDLLSAYLNMIADIVEFTFIDVCKEGQKMLIFASTKAMCGYIVSILKLRWPDIDSRRYVSEDSWNNLHDSTITVSTLGSSGTAVDIVNLKTCLMTVSVSSKQQSIQALGRLRPLINYEGDNPQFYYMYCNDIQSQMKYHKEKYVTFKGYCRSHRRSQLWHNLVYR